MVVVVVITFDNDADDNDYDDDNDNLGPCSCLAMTAPATPLVVARFRKVPITPVGSALPRCSMRA